MIIKNNKIAKKKKKKKKPFKAETKDQQNNDKIKQIISVPLYLVGNIIGRNGDRIKIYPNKKQCCHTNKVSLI